MLFSRKTLINTNPPKWAIWMAIVLRRTLLFMATFLTVSQGVAPGQNSANQLRSSLPSAVRQSPSSPEYSTGSTYQLRARYAVESQSENGGGTQVLPAATNLREVGQGAGAAPAPKVSRIPIGQSSAKKLSQQSAPATRQPNSDSPTTKSSDELSLSPSVTASPSSVTPTDLPSSHSSAQSTSSQAKQSSPASGGTAQKSGPSPTTLPAVDNSWNSNLPPLAEYPSLGQAGNAVNPHNGSVIGSGSLATDATFNGGSLPLPNNLPLPGAAPPQNAAQQPTLELSLPTATATPQDRSKRPTAKRTSPQPQRRTASLPPRSNQSNDKLMSMRSTQIHVGLNGPPSVEVGVPQLYHLVVANQDQVKLSGLIVRLDIPAGVQVQPQTATLGRAELENVSDGSVLVTWSFEGLSPGQQASVPLHLTTQSPNNFDMSLEWTFHPVTGSIPVEVRSPRLELALEGPNDVNYGQANTYRLHVSNQGSADATDVTAKLSAQQFGSSSIQIGTIAAGASETIDVELVFNEAGKIVIAADVTAQGEVAANAQTQVQVRQALLELLMEAPEMAYHGSAVPYKLVVKNSGDAVASQSKVVVTLPTGAKLDSTPSATSLDNGSLTWNVPDVRPGASAELTFQLSLSREGENQLVAHCTSPSGKSAQTSIATLVKAVTDLKLVVSDPSAPATVGGEVQYELTLLNRGSKTVEQVSVAAMFSRGIEPKRAEGHRHQVMPGQVRFEPITRIEPGETVTLRVVALAEAAGMHRFRAEVNTADADVKLVQEESTEFLESIRRTATVNSGSAVVR